MKWNVKFWSVQSYFYFYWTHLRNNLPGFWWLIMSILVEGQRRRRTGERSLIRPPVPDCPHMCVWGVWSRNIDQLWTSELCEAQDGHVFTSCTIYHVTDWGRVPTWRPTADPDLWPVSPLTGEQSATYCRYEQWTQKELFWCSGRSSEQRFVSFCCQSVFGHLHLVLVIIPSLVNSFWGGSNR